MGRFESPFQVAGLFLAASVVSVGFIFFINAEAHSRLSSLHHPVSYPDNNELASSVEMSRVIKEASLSTPPSSSAELTYQNGNYATSSLSPSTSPSASGEMTKRNVTLLNFLEDGLSKLFSLIKQAKYTYKSYYISKVDHSGKIVESVGEEVDSQSSNWSNKKHTRKKRKLAQDTTSRRRGTRRKRRAVITPNKRRAKVGENEPYYWQMLEDNEHHQPDKQVGRRHNQKELSGRNTGPNSQYPHYSQHFGESSHYYVASGSPAVASAFTGKSITTGDSHSGGHQTNNNTSSSGGNGGGNGITNTNPTSGFHKIRHAKDRLGGGGLDPSVLERMIFDTKSGPRSQQQPSKYNRVDYGHGYQHPPMGARFNEMSNRASDTNRDSQINQGADSDNDDDYKSGSSSLEILTTAVTKTTFPVRREDESHFVSQLTNQQQQLAQSLLPPTVTWFENEHSIGKDETDGYGDMDPNSSDDVEGEDTVDGNDSHESSMVASGESSSTQIKTRANGKRNNELPFPSLSSIVKADDDRTDYPLPFSTDDVVNQSGDGSDSKESVRRNLNPAFNAEDDSGPVVLMGNHHEGKDCYGTDDVLIVVAITCCLNFAFVLVIWALVRWFSISSNSKERDFQNLGDCDDSLDPTIVFHGVNEDPCWTLTSSGRKCDEVVFVGPNAHSGQLSQRTYGASVGGTDRIRSAHNQHLLHERTSRHIHHQDDADIYSAISATNMAPVITDRRLIGRGVGGPTFTDEGSIGSVYSFRPEHVPPHIIHRSYSQSMEDLHYLQ